jgi:hypothetical protein
MTMVFLLFHRYVTIQRGRVDPVVAAPSPPVAALAGQQHPRPPQVGSDDVDQDERVLLHLAPSLAPFRGRQPLNPLLVRRRQNAILTRPTSTFPGAPADDAGRKRRKRSTDPSDEDDDVAVVYPEVLNLNPRSEQSLPDLPRADGVNYVFPFSPAVKRESRQTDPYPESTTPVPDRANEIIIDVQHDQDQDLVEADAPADAPEGEEDEEEVVKVSVSQSVSESFSVRRVINDMLEAVTTTLAPLISSTEEEESESNEDSEETTTEAAATTTSAFIEATTTTTITTARRTRRPLLSRVQGTNSNLAAKPRVHPLLAAKAAKALKASEAEATTAASAERTRHPFFKQRTSLTTTTSTELPSPATEESTEFVEDVQESAEAREEEAEDEEETETTTKISLLAQRLQERLQKEAKRKDEEENQVESSENSPPVPGRINVLGNRNARPRFQVPTSLKDRLAAKLADREELRAKQEAERTDDNDDNNDNNEEEEETATRSSTRTTSRFRPPVWSSQTTTSSSLRITRPISRFSTSGRRSRFGLNSQPASTTPDTSSVSTDETTEAPLDRSTSSLSRLRNRFQRPLPSSTSDLSASPSNSNLFRGRSRSLQRPLVTLVTTEAPDVTTTTTKRTVADILAEITGEGEEEEKPVTLRPGSFKPKFGSRQKDAVRQRLREQLENQEKEESEDNITAPGASSYDNDDEVEEEEDVTNVDQPRPVTRPLRPTGRRTLNRGRSRSPSSSPPTAPRLAETPRSSSDDAVSSPRSNTLRVRSRSRLNLRPTNTAAEDRPLARPSLVRRPLVEAPPPPPPPAAVTEAAQGPVVLSNQDIMEGLGLMPKDDGEEEPEQVEVVEVAPADVPAAPVPQSGDELLLQLVKQNQAVQQQHEAAEVTTEGTAAATQAEQEVEETSEAFLPVPFNAQDFLKTAVVKSDLPPQVQASKESLTGGFGRASASSATRAGHHLTSGDRKHFHCCGGRSSVRSSSSASSYSRT